MRVVVVYESMFGNTRAIADAIAMGIADGNDVVVVPVGRAGPELIGDADLVIAGGPTHVHGMSRASTRQGALEKARKPGAELTIEAGADGPGLREWFESLGQASVAAAAFDTRVDGPAALTGRASVGISKQLRRHGFSVIAKPRSFLVTKADQLQSGEQEHAREWGAELAAALAADRRTSPRAG